MVDVSVIIVNYNTCSLTAACIDSVFAKTKDLDFEIILVDNASGDGSKEFFENDKRIKYIYLEKNIGFGRANNIGYEHSSGKYIFLLNSDTYLLNNALKLFFDKMENTEGDVACMGTLLQNLEGEIIHSYGRFITVGPLLKELIAGKPYDRYDPEEWKSDGADFFKVDYVTGADLFIRRSVIERCGFFDPDFFMYYEDAELQARFSRSGFYSYIFSPPKIVHLFSQSADRKKAPTATGRLIAACKKRSRRIYSERLFFKKTKSRYEYLFKYLPFTILETIVLFFTDLFDRFRNLFRRK